MNREDKDRLALYERHIVEADTLRLDLDIREHPRQAPEVDIFDEPTRCIKINEEWFKHIGGAISALAEWRAWIGDMDERNEAVQQVLKLLNGIECGEAFMFQLRQNPEVPCWLEQSFDGGDTWQFVFDYSLCQPALTVPTDQTKYLDDYIDFIGAYDDDPLSLAPDMEYDETDTDLIRDLALCQALTDAVAVMCALELKRREQLALGAALGAIILTMIGSVLVVTTFGIGSFLYVAFATALVEAFSALWSGLSEELLNDTDTQAIVACCMYDSLKGATITKSNFEDSLSGCDFAGGSPEAQLAGAIAGTITADGIFPSFVSGLEKAFKYASLGIAECPCIEPVVITYDFTIDDQGFTSDVGNVSGTPFSAYVSGQYWQAIAETNGTSNVNRTLAIFSPMMLDLPSNVEHIEIDYIFAFPHTTADDFTIAWNSGAHSFNVVSVSTGTHTLSVDINDAVDDFKIILRGAVNNSSAVARTTQIRLYLV